MQGAHAAALRWRLRALDAVVVAATFVGTALARQALRNLWEVDLVPGPRLLQDVSLQNQWHLGVLALPTWIAALELAGTYEELRRLRNDVLALRIVRAVASAALVLLAIVFLLQPEAPTSRSMLIAFSALSVVTLYAARRWQRARERRAHPRPIRILLVGDPRDAAPLLDAVARRDDWGLSVAGMVPAGMAPGGGVAEGAERPSAPGTEVPTLGTLAVLPDVLARENIGQVFLVGRTWDTATLRTVADACETVGVTFSMDANFLGLTVSRAELSDYEGWSALSFRSTPNHGEALVAKRVMDVLGASLALVLTAPLLAVVAVAIKLEDGGPVFFGQERSGLYGRTFRMWKFRSMSVDAEARKHALAQHNEMDGPVFKMRADPRVTRVGRFLRRTSLDEFPQFWNVLRGEMSLVGPRPPLPDEVARYARWQMRRLSMKPGITCIWQVSGRNDVDFDTWMRLDLQYIDAWSLFLDVKLLLRTVPAVLRGSGAR